MYTNPSKWKGALREGLIDERVIRQLDMDAWSISNKSAIENVIQRTFDRKLMVNVHRGLFLEAVVWQALKYPQANPNQPFLDWKQCEHWHWCDLERIDGLTLEVKNSAALQPWHESGTVPCRGQFIVGPNERGQLADCYVFAWHGVTDPDVADHRDTAQWEFFVVGTQRCDAFSRKRRISLETVRKLSRIGYGRGDDLFGLNTMVDLVRPKYPRPVPAGHPRFIVDD